MKTRISGLLIIPLLLLGLTACSSGVPQEEQAKSSDLENRLKKAAHLEVARGLLADSWELPGPDVLAFLAAVQSSDDSELKAAMGELLQGFISSLDSLPPELLGQALAAVQGAGDLDVADAVQALLFAVAQGGGGPELLVVAQAVHASQSQPLEQVISSILAEVLGQQGAPDLAQAIDSLASRLYRHSGAAGLAEAATAARRVRAAGAGAVGGRGCPRAAGWLPRSVSRPWREPVGLCSTSRVVGQQRQAAGVACHEDVSVGSAK